MVYKMQWKNQRSYSGRFFRPQPELCSLPESQTHLCVTSWGHPDAGKKVADDVKNFLTMSHGDHEVTVPYPKKSMMSSHGNLLRMGIILASEKVQKSFNESEDSAGFEMLAVSLMNNQLVYVSCGQPNLLFCRPSQGLFQLTVNHDLNFQNAQMDFQSPLPSQLLGIGQHPPLAFGNQRIEPGDFCIIISRSCLPPRLFATEPKQLDLTTVSDILASDNPDIPFWLSFLHFQ